MAKPSRKPEQPEAAESAAPGPDWLVTALAAAGLAVSGYLTWLKLAGAGAAFCTAGTGCDIVQSSRYALLLGVPTALWGALLYAALGALGLSGLRPGRWVYAFQLAAAGVGFSAYMTYLSLVELGAACVYCLASAAIAVALLLAVLWRRPPITGRKSPVRTPRLVAVGVSSAAVVILAGAFIFAIPTPAPPGYQEALARHLSGTGAIFYGAYW